MNRTGPLSCEEALELLAALIDAELEPVDRSAVERHLDICRSCFSRAEFERRLKQQFAQVGHHAVDRTFEDRIRTMIGRFMTVPDPAPDLEH